jgi:hypothetical protein
MAISFQWAGLSWDGGKNHLVLFRANFRRYRRTKSALPAPENLYPVFREMKMIPNRVPLRDDSFVADDASKPALDGLETAKARQDLSHQKLERFIAEALAELSDEVRAA